MGCSDIIQERLIHRDDLPTDESELELEYPLTPPLSEASESRSHSPDIEDPPVQLNVTTVCSFRKGASHHRSREVAVRRRGHRRWSVPTSKWTLNISFTDKDSSHDPLTLHIISRSASKAAIASAARFLLDEEFRRRQNSHDQDHVMAYELPIPELNSILEGRFTL